MLIRRCDFVDRADLLAVHALQRASYEVESALIGTREIPGLREPIEELAASREVFWGCFEGVRLAGVIATEDNGGTDTARGEAPCVRISRLAVDPAFFRRGVGRRLVRFVVDDYGRGRSRVVQVSTGAANAPGRLLYESEGFRLIRERVVSGDGAERVKVVEYQWG